MYRLNFVGDDRRTYHSVKFQCADDFAAVAFVEQYRGSRATELWIGTRPVALFEPSQGAV